MGNKTVIRPNYEVIGNFFEGDDDDLEFHRVTNSIDVVDREYGTEVIFKYYRRHGFPHYKIREDEKHKHMKKLISFNHNTIIDDTKIIQTMHCLRLAWTYFPHFWKVRCGSSRLSPMEAFNDDETFKSVIRKCWNWQIKHYKGEDPKGERNKFHENRLRQSLKLYSGIQAVSNFRPTAAKYIYETYGGDGVTWDMSSGWGGRLLGALSSARIKKYIGTEPSSKTYGGLVKIKNEFSYLNTDVELFMCGSEEFSPNKKTLDLCFTSPPYFDTEKYSYEPTQSYIKFPTSDGWMTGFLKQTLQNCYYGLKDGGYLLMNIANTSKYKFIERGMKDMAKKMGFDYIDELQLTLSSVMGAGYKYEPIFIFKKV